MPLHCLYSYFNGWCVSVYKHTCTCHFSVGVAKHHEGRGEMFTLGYSSRGIMVHHGRKDIAMGRIGLEVRAGSWLITFHPHTGSRERGNRKVGPGYKTSNPNLSDEFSSMRIHLLNHVTFPNSTNWEQLLKYMSPGLSMHLNISIHAQR